MTEVGTCLTVCVVSPDMLQMSVIDVEKCWSWLKGDRGGLQIQRLQPGTHGGVLMVGWRLA